MTRNELERYLGRCVTITLLDNTVIEGTLHKTGEKAFENDPNLSVPINFYFCIDVNNKVVKNTAFRVSHIRRISCCEKLTTNFEKIKSMSINEMASKRLIWKDEFGDTHTSVEQINGKFVGDRDVREKLFEYEQEESEGKLIHLPYKIGSEVFVTPDRGKTMTNFEKIKSMSINEMASKRLIWKDEFGDTHTSVEQINGKFVGDRDVREKLFEYEQEESEGKLIHLPYKIGSEVFVTPDRGKTMTNFEKIKQMSIDEMARSRMFFFDCPYGTPCVGCSKGKEFNNNCTDCTKHWLESEVDTD